MKTFTLSTTLLFVAQVALVYCRALPVETQDIEFERPIPDDAEHDAVWEELHRAAQNCVSAGNQIKANEWMISEAICSNGENQELYLTGESATWQDWKKCVLDLAQYEDIIALQKSLDADVDIESMEEVLKRLIAMHQNIERELQKENALIEQQEEAERKSEIQEIVAKTKSKLEEVDEKLKNDQDANIGKYYAFSGSNIEDLVEPAGKTIEENRQRTFTKELKALQRQSEEDWNSEVPLDDLLSAEGQIDALMSKLKQPEADESKEKKNLLQNASGFFSKTIEKAKTKFDKVKKTIRGPSTNELRKMVLAPNFSSRKGSEAFSGNTSRKNSKDVESEEDVSN